MGPRFESVKAHQLITAFHPARMKTVWSNTNRDPAKRSRFVEEEQTEWMSFRASAEAKDMKFVLTWPVGQVVKTAASHAVNIGSNPVRVTSQKEARGVSFPPAGENCTLLPPFFLPHEAGFMRV